MRRVRAGAGGSGMQGHGRRRLACAWCGRAKRGQLLLNDALVMGQVRSQAAARAGACCGWPSMASCSLIAWVTRWASTQYWWHW